MTKCYLLVGLALIVSAGNGAHSALAATNLTESLDFATQDGMNLKPKQQESNDPTTAAATEERAAVIAPLLEPIESGVYKGVQNVFNGAKGATIAVGTHSADVVKKLKQLTAEKASKIVTDYKQWRLNMAIKEEKALAKIREKKEIALIKREERLEKEAKLKKEKAENKAKEMALKVAERKRLKQEKHKQKQVNQALSLLKKSAKDEDFDLISKLLQAKIEPDQYKAAFTKFSGNKLDEGVIARRTDAYAGLYENAQTVRGNIRDPPAAGVVP